AERLLGEKHVLPRASPAQPLRQLAVQAQAAMPEARAHEGRAERARQSFARPPALRDVLRAAEEEIAALDGFLGMEPVARELRLEGAPVADGRERDHALAGAQPAADEARSGPHQFALCAVEVGDVPRVARSVEE